MHSDSPPLAGRVAIVTGGGSGVGKAIALQLGAAGVRVAILDIQAAAAAAVAQQIAADGGQAQAFPCDLADTHRIPAVAAQVAAALGAPSLLFNVAGLVHYQRVEDLAIERFQQLLAVNLTGAFALSQAVLPGMAKTGGSIVNVASMAGHLGIPYLSAYCAAKGGLIALTKSMAKEFADRGVRINVLAPGGIDTPMADVPFYKGANPELLPLIPMSPIGKAKPEHIAALAIFVASPASGNLSGAMIPVDGAST